MGSGVGNMFSTDENHKKGRAVQKGTLFVQMKEISLEVVLLERAATEMKETT